MFRKRVELSFLLLIAIALGVLIYNSYKSYVFKNSEISLEHQKAIERKEREILFLMRENFGYAFKFPLIVTDKFKGRVYGLTTYKDGEIAIYLNKKVMQESMDYIIDSVIAHEYAHALMFKSGYLHVKEDGHSELWRETCVKLGGKDCRRYVDREEIILSKMPFQ